MLNDLTFGTGTGPVFIESLDCHGSENELLECTEVNLRREFCTNENDVAIQCFGMFCFCDCIQLYYPYMCLY